MIRILLVKFSFLIYLCSFSVLALERTGMICTSINNSNQLVFYFNNKKAFNLDLHVKDNEKIINDEYAYIKNDTDLGDNYLKQDNILYWEKNPWNGYYTYKLDLNSLQLVQRYILKKNLLNRTISDLFNKSNFFIKKTTFTCKIEKKWKEIENFFLY